MTEHSYHHGDLRNALIDKGIELINQEGIEKLTLRKVASMCSVSQAAPYSHFKNKEDLLLAMQEYVTNQFMNVLNKSVSSCTDPNDPCMLIQLGKAYVMFFIRYPQYFSFLFSQSMITVDLTLDSDQKDNFPPFELLKKIAFQVFGENSMSREQMQDMIISLWATVHGLASIATMKNVRYDKDWDTKIEDIIWNKMQSNGEESHEKK